MGIATDLNKISGKVEYLLEKYPSLRDDDKKLFIVYLNVYHGLKATLSPGNYEAFKEIFLKAPYFESIRRSRQKLQEMKSNLQGKNRKARLDQEEKVVEELHEMEAHHVGES